MSEPVRQTLILFGCVIFMALLTPFMMRNAQRKADAVHEGLRDLEEWWKARRRGGEHASEPKGPLIPRRRIIEAGVHLLFVVVVLAVTGYATDVSIPFMLVVLSLLTAYGLFQMYLAWTGSLRGDPEPEEAIEEQPEEKPPTAL